MKKPLITIAALLVAAHAIASNDDQPIVAITWAKDGQPLVVGSHRFVDSTGALVPFAATMQQRFPYSTCTLEGSQPTYQSKQLAIGRTLILEPQRTPRGTIHLDIQAEDTAVRTVKTTDHGTCRSMSPVTDALSLTSLPVDLPAEGAITVSFPDAHYSLTLRFERDAQ
ncbi:MULTISPECIES: hypothetical protein [Burkholderia cepacia complex]|uniref:Uncharacterized protein n=2 Tax=Burkholderia cepacia complex TaxID=87882 RepID=A0A228EAI2_9BURK|nr:MULTISPECIES: hypothetical protein [Burkholderia cepacia complex]AIO71750.1 hypothetical protein DM80_5839 [Burkholderia multivorans]AOK69221.1 hypothetical protein WM33_26515 [Burkholderia multivorans]KVV34479.1 hypothetical protein WK80_03235 [Burkholderia multivorans]KVZ76069.1 hypothetical protein WL23_21955 [Burkholderia multivorans]MBJ9616045.1 hypothetical protein [Burkholderia multivorans]